MSTLIITFVIIATVLLTFVAYIWSSANMPNVFVKMIFNASAALGVFVIFHAFG